MSVTLETAMNSFTLKRGTNDIYEYDDPVTKKGWRFVESHATRESAINAMKLLVTFRALKILSEA